MTGWLARKGGLVVLGDPAATLSVWHRSSVRQGVNEGRCGRRVVIT